jgi:hypothetical protein
MSSIAFRTWLEGLGYKANNRDASLDWIFGISENTRNFFTWMCNNISHENIISSDELKAYAQLHFAH